MKQTTTEKINYIVQKASSQAREEFVEFAKKSFTNIQLYTGKDVKKELNEVLNTHSTDSENKE